MTALDELLESQLHSARFAADSACLAGDILVMARRGKWDELGQDWSEEKRQASQQLRHLDRYMRQPHDPGIPEVYRRLGQRVDRALYAGHAAVYAAIQLVEGRRLDQERRRLAAAHEQRRVERLERERERREQQAAKQREIAAQPVVRPKRPKREPKPLCLRCGKRPRVSAGLCGPCARWGGNA